MSLERRRVIVTGRVQNVWYRDSCRTEALSARSHGLGAQIARPAASKPCSRDPLRLWPR